MSLLSLLPLMIILVGGYILIKLRFFYILHPIRTVKFAFSGENTKNSIISLLLALAGTLGVGNIVGVAFGIYVGGAGSVFWLCVSAFFSSAIKYAEVGLSSYHTGGWGFISVIEDSGAYQGLLPKLYAALALILSFAMGSLLQAEAISDATKNFDAKIRISLLAVIFIFTCAVCVSGKKKIKNAVAAVIPIATVIYSFCCLFIIFSEANKIPAVIKSILSSAFNFSALSGGVSAFLISSGIKEGFARGLLSNEAGAGTSSFSHTSHIEDKNTAAKADLYDDNYARRAAFYGVLEVIFDTLLLCPLTAFAILLGTDIDSFNGTLGELSTIFEGYIGRLASTLLTFSVTAFAISTVLCWYYYGRVSFSYLTRGKSMSIFSFLFISSFAVGLFFEIPSLIFINDTVLFFLSVITLYTLMRKRRKISELIIGNDKKG
ncbi:MAG: alanine:cation symporter family protein [Clostridia bacterium]|nr:alanine:cation symporter family protein [Clostridia bacterium]